MLYLLGVLGSLIKRDSTKFEKKSMNIFAVVFLSNVNALLLSTTLKFEISVFCGIPTDVKVSNNSLGFPIFSESLSSKNARFFAVINFNVLYFTFFVQLFTNMKSGFLKFFEKFVPSVYIFNKINFFTF